MASYKTLSGYLIAICGNSKFFVSVKLIIHIFRGSVWAACELMRWQKAVLLCAFAFCRDEQT